MAGEVEALLDPILMLFDNAIQTRIAGHLVTTYLQGSAQTISWARATKDARIVVQPFEGPPIQEAIDYAQKRCATLIRRLDGTPGVIDEETRARFTKIISDGIKNKRGIPGLQADIRKEFRDMSTRRAQTIARTETSQALETAFMDRSKAMGVTGKRIVVGDPCKLCQDNAAEGVVPIGHVFSSGQEHPPFHPRCVCALAPVMLEEPKEERVTAGRR